MLQASLFKVYGHIYPITDALYADLSEACSAAMPDNDDLPLLCREGDMARISFEGSYFPDEEVLAAVQKHLRPEQQGKLDVLDMDSWRLTRHVFKDGQIHSSAAPLNNVLDYSGH